MKLIRRSLVAAVFVALLTVSAFAQGGNVNQDRINALKPPPGAKVAIVLFEDLQCPDCARAHPLVKQVAEMQKVPVVHHDFPLPMHPWAKQAAIYGRFFDSKGAKVGAAFRDFIFINQPSIIPENLKDKVNQFAKQNNIAMPFLLDPGRKFEAKVDADVALGKKIGIQHTPTIFVVGTTKMKAEPFVEVVDRSQLSQMIQDMKNASK